MNFDADMVRDQSYDALTIGCAERLATIGEPLGKSVDPEPPIGVEHHLDGHGVVQKPGDRRPERGA